MSLEVAAAAMSASAAMNAMVSSVSAETGIDPVTIVTIITTIIQLIQNCKKPANQKDVDSILADVAKNHPDKCPIWLRGAFRDSGIRSLAKVHETWSVIADHAVHHPAQVGAMMLAA